MGDFHNIKKSQKNFAQNNPYDLCSKSYSDLSKLTRNLKNSRAQHSGRYHKRTIFKDSKISQGVQTQEAETYDVQNSKVKIPYTIDQCLTTREEPKVSQDEKNIKKAACPLNDPDLPPVSEVDHLCARCYCELCTCGQHFCPYQRRNNLYPVSMFKTNYHNNFKSKTALRQDKISVHQGYKLSNKAKIETLTTKMQDFKPIEIPKEFNPYAEMELNRPQTTVVRQKFFSSSQYQQNYPNWGPTYPIFEGPAHLKIKPSQLHFEGKSSYAQNFRNPTDLLFHSQQSNNQIDMKTTQSLISTRSTVAPFAMASTAPLNDKTSYQTNYWNKHKESLQSKNQLPKTTVPSKLYKTTYQSIYKGMQPYIKFPTKGGKKKFCV